jgi:uncharacterized protein YqiB (DUF1249 family)
MLKSKYSVDLIKQMAECDANYIRLLKLVPQLAIYRDITLSRPVKSDKESASATRPLKRVPGSQNENLVGLKTEFAISETLESDDPVTVRIEVLESFRYTNTLEIVQKPEIRKLLTNPAMVVRIYHDASSAEVISAQGHKVSQARYLAKNPKMYYADEKMRVNAFLGEWLTHCLKVGRSTQAPEELLRM